MSNLKLDSSHDIIIGRGTTKVDGDEFTVQLVKCRLLLTLGEWELDSTLGVPWIQDILVNDPDSSLIKGVLRDTILNTPKVASVSTLDMSINRTTRALQVAFTARTESGATISSEV